jgi:hypothetical protein
MADKKGIQTILVEAVILIRDDFAYRPGLSNCWLPASTLVEALQKSGHNDASILIDVCTFNTAISKASAFGAVMSRFDGSNQSGVFRINNHHHHYHYLTKETKQAPYPCTLNQVWKERVLEIAANAHVIPSTRARPHTLKKTRVLAISVGLETDANEDEQASNNKRQRLDIAYGFCSYWPASPEAYQLFAPRDSIDISGGSNNNTEMITIDPQEAMEHRINELQAVYESEDSWRCVAKGGDPTIVAQGPKSLRFGRGLRFMVRPINSHSET